MLNAEERETLNLNKPVIQKEVERLSELAMQAISKRDWTFTASLAAQRLRQHHIAPEWSADFDNYLEPLNFEQQIDALRNIFESNPNAYYEVVDISSQVEDDLQFAKVFLSGRLGGLGETGGSSVCHFSEFRWRCSNEDGRWLWFHSVTMRGFNCTRNAGIA